jgi:7,8-dihydropterin-6-yl-methyl-4-(beta-D-ribofuranosyl)aminobenzene 5'-phosphate synthase
MVIILAGLLLLFSGSFKKRMVGFGLEPLLVKGPAKICENLFTSGEFDYMIPEQALVLNTKKGLVVITGCSHPGIIEMLKTIKSAFNKNIYMVFGGFHLLDKSEKEMNSIISEMKALGVVKCGATHCTGDKQIKMFRDAFGENYFELGVGNTIVIN